VLGDVVEAQKFGYPDFHNNIPYIHDLLNQWFVGLVHT
jgi:hypothetical protein